MVSQVFYLNEIWDVDDGGEFVLLDGQMKERQRILPRLGDSVIIRRSSDSWHEVLPIRSMTRSRLSLSVCYYKP